MGERVELPGVGALVEGRYRVAEKLAAGGMGAVYRATDERTGAAVALKYLHPEIAREREMRRRFRREASILQAVDHPAVVKVHGVGEEDAGLAFMVMELLQGETLYARLERERQLEPDVVAAILEGVAAGLDAVHAHGVLHGDLKPANIFLAEAGGERQVKLVDFGTSKVHGLDRLTRTGEVIGTPIYMPPELLTGDGTIDERIDTYAMGVLAYECLVGEPPFLERHPGKLLFQIVMGQAVPLAEVRPDLSPAIRAVVERAMHPKRDERFATAPPLAAAFRQACDSSRGAT